MHRNASTNQPPNSMEPDTSEAHCMIRAGWHVELGIRVGKGQELKRAGWQSAFMRTACKMKMVQNFIKKEKSRRHTARVELHELATPGSDAAESWLVKVKVRVRVRG